MIKILENIEQIIEDYDVFLIDQWGVIHNGFNGFPKARKVLEMLKERDKIVIILSNSSKPYPEASGLLTAMGFVEKTHYDHLVTSGIDVRAHLEKRDDNFYRALGNRVFRYPSDPCRALLENLPYQEMFSEEEADFILCSGEEEGKTLEEYRPTLEKAVRLGLPLICPNPDRVSLSAQGVLEMCPGAIAELYEELGGTVRWHGKPYAPIYESCVKLALENLGNADKKRFVGVGDSLHHDIQGANNAGMASLLICSGIHGGFLVKKEEVDIGALDALCEEKNIFPTYGMVLLN